MVLAVPILQHFKVRKTLLKLYSNFYLISMFVKHIIFTVKPVSFHNNFAKGVSCMYRIYLAVRQVFLHKE